MSTLRYYQEDAKNAVQLSLEEYDKVLLALPTGSGKTVVAAHLIADLQPKRCLFLADQDELCSQPLTVISREAGIIPALEKAKSLAPLTARVVVASSQTLHRQSRLERFPPKWFDLVIVDEAHRGADRDAKISDHLAKKVVGITATPFRADLRDLSKYYQDVAYSMPIMDLVAEGFAPPIKVLNLPVEIDLSGVETSRGFDGKDYESESLSTTIAPYYERIVELIKEHAFDRHTIAFLPLIKSSEAFASIARATGITAVHIDGKSPDREEILEAFRRGRFQMLCNANVVETGVDIPVADCYVNLRPTRSLVKYQQSVGRCFRVLPGTVDEIAGAHQKAERRERIASSQKPDVLLLDFLWQHDKLGLVRPGSLIAKNAEEAEAIYEKIKKQKSPEDLERIYQLVQEEREAALVKRLEHVASRSGMGAIDPQVFGYLTGNQSIMEYEPVARWEMDRPSGAQLERLAKWGFNTAAIESKGLASHLMSACIHRFRSSLATAKQLRVLSRMGASFDPTRLTIGDASTLITQVNMEKIRAGHRSQAVA